MKRQRVDRSETAIPCLLIFTKPILVGGVPVNMKCKKKIKVNANF